MTQVRNSLRRFLPVWLAVSLAAAVFILAVDFVRLRHVQRVSNFADEPAGDAQADNGARLPGDPPEWRPRLIVPGHNNPSFEWLALTREMFARGEWRVRRIDYENAPLGHDVFTPSPYRWWLGAVAWGDHVLSGRPFGPALERAALIADPLLHLLLMIGVVAFARWRFGGFAAALGAWSVAGAFPLAVAFLPGVPEDIGLAAMVGIFSVLPLLAGVQSASPKGATSRDAAAPKSVGVWFLVGGIVGGIGLWVSVAREVPVLLGIGLGGLLAVWFSRRGEKASEVECLELPWRLWALGGAVATLAAFLIEYAPGHLAEWHWRVVHPLFGVAWLGGGELLTRVCAWRARGRAMSGFGEGLLWIFGVLSLVSVPVAMRLTHSWGFLASDLTALQLARIDGSPSATGFFSWLVHDGLSGTLVATIAPLLLVAPAAWLWSRATLDATSRAMLAVAFGVVAMSFSFACRQLTLWHGVDATVVTLVLVAAAGWRQVASSTAARWMLPAVLAVALLPGAIRALPRSSGAGNALEPQEIYGLVERDLARWLVNQHGNSDAILLAPHNQAIALHYYGGWRGIPTFGWENREGLNAAVRITSASTPEEAWELIRKRSIAQLIIPSWDSYLDEYARMGMGTVEGTFLATLHDWKLPGWLRPVAYPLPRIAGFEGESVVILEFVDEQDEPAVLSRLAEYFAEMGQLDRAALVAQALRRFPADLGAVVARAQVEIARSDSAAFERTVELLKPRVTSGGDRVLPWDRRLALSVVLYQGKLRDLARERLKRCVQEADEAKVRALSTTAIYRMLALTKALGVPFSDEKLHELALTLLPREARERL